MRTDNKIAFLFENAFNQGMIVKICMNKDEQKISGVMTFQLSF
ncbi:hypothetical protein CSB69_0426 [Morganella morganii]|nr:hypothetical protein CSB69_0426 [Morganella morganii]